VRIRAIKPEFWTDARVGEWDARRALFFVGLWQVADDSGRLRLDPRLIRAELDPFDAKFGGVDGVTDLLEELVELGRVLVYEAEGQRLGLVAHFAEHQVINRPTKSRLPVPPEGLREPSVSPPGGLTRNVGVEGKGREGIRDQGREPGSPAARPGARKTPRASDPRLKLLEDHLVAAYVELRGGKYLHAGAKDAKALQRLLQVAEPVEIERRWRLALAAAGFFRCSSFAELAIPAKWGHFDGTEPKASGSAPAAPSGAFTDGDVEVV
jgi:hypothetical protein